MGQVEIIFSFDKTPLFTPGYLSSEEFELSMDLLGEEGEVELESCLCWRGGCLLAMLGLL